MRFQLDGRGEFGGGCGARAGGRFGGGTGGEGGRGGGGGAEERGEGLQEGLVEGRDGGGEEGGGVVGVDGGVEAVRDCWCGRSDERFGRGSAGGGLTVVVVHDVVDVVDGQAAVGADLACDAVADG